MRKRVEMRDDSDAQDYLSSSNKKIRKLASELHKIFVKQGCVSYVKTIYIGYDIEGQMVAALYCHEDRVEVALALDENHVSPILIDATHLTWRSMPVAAVVRNDRDLSAAALLVVEASLRVKAGKNTLNRSSEFFAEVKKNKRLAEEGRRKKR